MRASPLPKPGLPVAFFLRLQVAHCRLNYAAGSAGRRRSSEHRPQILPGWAQSAPNERGFRALVRIIVSAALDIVSVADACNRRAQYGTGLSVTGDSLAVRVLGEL